MSCQQGGVTRVLDCRGRRVLYNCWFLAGPFGWWLLKISSMPMHPIVQNPIIRRCFLSQNRTIIFYLLLFYILVFCPIIQNLWNPATTRSHWCPVRAIFTVLRWHLIYRIEKLLPQPDSTKSGDCTTTLSRLFTKLRVRIWWEGLEMNKLFERVRFGRFAFLRWKVWFRPN